MFVGSLFPLLALVIVALFSIQVSSGCYTVEFFKVSGSDICYRRFNDKKRTWLEAQALCESHGLQMVEDPVDDTALGKYIAEDKEDDPDRYWMGARDEFGTGTFKYTHSGNTIPDNLSGGGCPLEYCMDGCLTMAAISPRVDDPYYVPYFRQPCGKPYAFTICQDAAGNSVPSPASRQWDPYPCRPPYCYT